MKSSKSHDHAVSLPLFVDLDGTLIKTDTLYESLLLLVKRMPWTIFLMPFWLLRGKAGFKAEVARRVQPDYKHLPYNQTVLEYMKSARESGRKIYLATAANQTIAKGVAAHLGCFDGLVASSTDTNVSGKAKVDRIRELAGKQDIAYMGDAIADLPVFTQAAQCLLVYPKRNLKRRIHQVCGDVTTLAERPGQLRLLLKAMRIYQWVKNLLVFVPLLAAQLFNQGDLVLDTVLGFFIFSLLASSIYLVNDLLDLPSDRAHPRKCKRPFASGELDMRLGIALSALIPVITLISAWLLSEYFFYILILYLLITLSYSFVLKEYVLIDVIILASLYTIRVLAGAAIIQVMPSFWLLAFSMFIFTSLALVKRCSELISLSEKNRSALEGRDYMVTDYESLQSMGIASGYISVLVVALFINSDAVIGKYSLPEGLWLICPALLYWISRVWLKTARGEMLDDPIIYSMKDRGSRFIALVIALSVFIAI